MARGVLVVVQQPAQPRRRLGGGVGGGQGPGVLADQVVQPVPAAGGLGDQVLVVQGLQAAAGGAQIGLVQRGGGIGVDVGAGVQAQAAEQPLLSRGEVRVGQVERGGDRQVLGAASAPAGPERRPGRRPARPAVQAGWWCSWRASIPTASGRYPHSRVISADRRVAGIQARPGREPDQQLGRLLGRQGVQADRAARPPARSGAGGW